MSSFKLWSGESICRCENYIIFCYYVIFFLGDFYDRMWFFLCNYFK